MGRPIRLKSSPHTVGGRCASMDATYPPKLLGNPGPAAYSSLHHHEDPIPERSCHTRFLRSKPDAHRMYAQDQVVIHTVRM
jgi:hypothetical protein